MAKQVKSALTDVQKLNKLQGLLRYVGLNLTPQSTELVLTLNAKLESEGDITLNEIDTIIDFLVSKYESPKEEGKPKSAPKLVKK